MDTQKLIRNILMVNKPNNKIDINIRPSHMNDTKFYFPINVLFDRNIIKKRLTDNIYGVSYDTIMEGYHEQVNKPLIGYLYFSHTGPDVGSWGFAEGFI